MQTLAVVLISLVALLFCDPENVPVRSPTQAKSVRTDSRGCGQHVGPNFTGLVGRLLRRLRLRVIERQACPP